jgi:hypothetical protein
MNSGHIRPEDLEWTCDRCGVNLVPGPVTVTYMGSRLSTELPLCPGCGFVLVTEAVALGRMAEVEQILEDK